MGEVKKDEIPQELANELNELCSLYGDLIRAFHNGKGLHNLNEIALKVEKQKKKILDLKINS